MYFNSILVSCLVCLCASSIGVAKQHQGAVVLYNNCRFPLYIEEVAEITFLDTKLASQQRLYRPFRLAFNGTGTSLKASTEWQSSNVAQIEYSACYEGSGNTDCHPLNMVYYDLSKINDAPNAEFGVFIEPSFAECATVFCPVNVHRCESTYYHPEDNFAVKACDVGTDLNVTFCPN